MRVKNFFIKGFISLIKKVRTRISAEPKNFLIVSTTGLGDTLWGTPAIRALREKYPHSYIAVLTSAIGKEVLQHNPHLNDIFVFNKSSPISLFHLFFSLRKKKIDTVLIFHTSQRLVLPFCFLLARSVIGTKEMNKGLDCILTESTDRKPMHEIARRLEITGRVGASCISPQMELPIGEKDRLAAEMFLQVHKIPGPIPMVGLHPGSKDKFKQWPLESFIELGLKLKEHLGCQIIVTGNHSESELVETVARRIPGAIRVHGELPLRPLAVLIQQMAVMISNDTGPMHVAFAMQTPTVALFGPTDSKLCGPYYASHVKVLQKNPTCTPCLRKKCMDPFCMRQIGIQEVYDEALKLFHKDCL